MVGFKNHHILKANPPKIEVTKDKFLVKTYSLIRGQYIRYGTFDTEALAQKAIVVCNKEYVTELDYLCKREL